MHEKNRALKRMNGEGKNMRKSDRDFTEECGAIPIERYLYALSQRKNRPRPSMIYMRKGPVYVTPANVYIQKTRRRIKFRSSTMYESAISPMRYTGCIPVSKTELRTARKANNRLIRELKKCMKKLSLEAAHTKVPVKIHARSAPRFNQSGKILPETFRRK